MIDFDEINIKPDLGVKTSRSAKLLRASKKNFVKLNNRPLWKKQLDRYKAGKASRRK